MKYIFGIDVGGTTVKVGLFDADAQLLDKWEIRTRTEEHGAHILQDIAASLQAKIQEKGLNREDIVGAGLGVPGPVTSDGTVLTCVNLGWDRFNVSETLSALAGMPVKAGNDANVAALGEMWQGGAKGYHSVLMITLGTGVGGGAIIEGNMIAGNHGAACEIGHMAMNVAETVPCNCGKKGCLEQYASATGIVNEAKKALAVSSQPSTLRDVAELTAKDIFDEAKKGDALAMEQVEKLGYYLGLALSHACTTIDPEVIVIGGGVSKAGEIIPNTVRKYYDEYSFRAQREAKIVLAELGNDAGIYGSAKLVLG